MSGYLVDTSVFIAAEQGRQLGAAPPGDARISVVTLTELGFGVFRASNEPLRVLRRATLGKARRFVALPYDEAVADRLAELLAGIRASGRRFGAMDVIIASTALTHGLTVWTRDADFELLASIVPRLGVARG